MKSNLVIFGLNVLCVGLLFSLGFPNGARGTVRLVLFSIHIALVYCYWRELTRWHLLVDLLNKRMPEWDRKTREFIEKAGEV